MTNEIHKPEVSTFGHAMAIVRDLIRRYQLEQISLETLQKGLAETGPLTRLGLQDVADKLKPIL